MHSRPDQAAPFAAGAASEPCAVRPPATGERAEFLALAHAAGAHGVYVANDLSADRSGRALAARGVGFYGRGRALGLAWFGARGNLVVVLAPDACVEASLAARAIADVDSPWRIALGPEPVLRALTPLLPSPPVLVRRQVYCEADAARVNASPVDARVRLAVAADVEALVQASLLLNQSDLHLDPDRVSQRWLKHATRERLRARTSFVLGPVGAPYAKLDVGHQGAAGAVIEGVFTAPEQRGHGHATALVHAVNHRLLAAGRPRVCLHVAEGNAAARACYAHAGMREVDVVSLLLKSV